MKRFQFITESDARLLDLGSTVVLADGGQVTPLALDTLRERRVRVVRDAGDDESVTLAPPMPVRVVALSGDHTSSRLREAVRTHLRGLGVTCHDSAVDDGPSDYPDTAAVVALAVARHEADAGIVIDGSGLGSAIAANKIDGIRAAACADATMARYAREHNGANVLALGSSVLTPDTVRPVVDAFIGSAMHEPRYLRRLLKIRALEQRRPR
ncbi:MAG: RpiB/LacA/LacB family sugar-phosphate isomerase [Vicinamibacterales bacterium]